MTTLREVAMESAKGELGGLVETLTGTDGTDIAETVFAEAAGGGDPDNGEEEEEEEDAIETGAGRDITLAADVVIEGHPPDGWRAYCVAAGATLVLALVQLHVTSLDHVVSELQSQYSSPADKGGSSTLPPPDYPDYYYNPDYPSPREVRGNATDDFTYYGSSDVTEKTGDVSTPGEVSKKDDDDQTTIPAEDFDQVKSVYNDVFGLFGLVSGVLILTVNYRVTGILGGVIAGVGCLSASFVHPNVHLLLFLGSALPAIGHNMLHLSALVATMEYFRRRRFGALLVADLGMNVAEVLGPLLMSLLQAFLPGAAAWRTLVQSQAVLAVLCSLLSITLAPARSKVKDSDGESLRSRMLDLSGLHLFKRPMTYVLAGLSFGYAIGKTLPDEKLPGYFPSFLIFEPGSLVQALVGLARFISKLIVCTCPSQPSLRATSAVSAVLCVICGAVNMASSAFGDVIFVICYAVIFGLLTGVVTPLLTYMVPVAMGEEHLGLSSGSAEFAGGLGALVASPWADALVGVRGNKHASFYLAGSALIATAIGAAVVAIVFTRLRGSRVASSPSDDGDQTRERTEELTVEEAV